MERPFVTVDGNEAAAHVAYQTAEVVAIYPITPASSMGELADAWAAAGRPNIFGDVPRVIEMQSEGGAAGAVHGALQAGALTTSFTASQGLLLMLPNMYKIAGELTPCVLHVAARTLATHALSIFGDHSDVMSARGTGWAMLCAASVQEAQDFALLSQMATLESRVPFLHFFDGFRTSHEVAKIEQLLPEDVRALVDPELVRRHRDRALTPDAPVLRGTAQNPDVFFQAREAANPFHDAVPEVLETAMQSFAERVGRRYELYEYAGAPDAEQVVVMMGSGAGAVLEVVEALVARGEKVGLLQVRLFRPFDMARCVAALPESARSVAVLDRTKEPGSAGEPLFQDIVTALVEERPQNLPRMIGGRYGLSSKEFTPAMALAVFDELRKPQPKRRFTVGIRDDVTHLSLDWDPERERELGLGAGVTRAVFYGLGSDGTVGANKNSVKIVGEGTSLAAQGYFVYDSKKSGSVTVSHLRFSQGPIRSTYLLREAGFVACHQFTFLDKFDVLELAEAGGVFLLNSPYGPDQVWQRLPREVQQALIAKQLRFFVVDADKVAAEAGMGGRINTVMQTCFFALAEVLPTEDAIARIKAAIEKSYGRRGQAVLDRNYAAVDGALAALHEVPVPDVVTSELERRPAIVASGPNPIPDFVERVTARILAGQGDLLPVSALPPDGTFPTGTARLEKRSIAREIPVWDAELCIECALCALVCPHTAVRMKPYDERHLEGAPEGFASREWKGKEFRGQRMTIQIAPDDCTGCGICVEVCPARSKEVAKHKALDMESLADNQPLLERERANLEHFLAIPELDRTEVDAGSLKGSQSLEPLFEYSGACSGCGETPYLTLLTQLYGDRLLVANATGCSSIYGGNLPTTPWTTNAQGRGPAWSNSLFEDNAEFGLGIRLAADHRMRAARRLLVELSPKLGAERAQSLLVASEKVAADPDDERALAELRAGIAALKSSLADLDTTAAADLLGLADALARKSVWIVGGDGWAYDIGYGGLDHVLATGEDVNVLVLDTGVYSNTGGQASKATPRAAVAKFAAAGKESRRKDLGRIASAYGNVYVAQVAMGANPKQTLKALREAESWPGPSLVIAYSHCIAHGIDMRTSMGHQKLAATTGFWPLWRYDPRRDEAQQKPFQLDSKKPSRPFREFAVKEGRFSMLMRAAPERANKLLADAQRDLDEQWFLYEQMAGIESLGDGAGGGDPRPAPPDAATREAGNGSAPDTKEDPS